jgi:hypothetical protein
MSIGSRLSSARTMAVAVAVTVALSAAAAPDTRGTSGAPAVPVAPAPAGAPVNLSHLDFLRDEVTPPEQPGHTTYRLESEPGIGMLWTYAEPGPDGRFRRLGGGTYDPDTDTYGQGAFNADDVSRAAVVYVRHWNRHRDGHSREAARELLRGLTYLQTTTGPNTGRVVLWAQPDGTLNPSAEPEELPDPSDSGPSYWLARTIWALGEGYAAFRDADPEFAGFLRDRLGLALAALDRDVLGPRYGTYQVVDGVRVPAWLIVDGADATAEAILGLAAYVEAAKASKAAGTEPSAAGETAPAARKALARLSRGVAELSAGDARTWPYGAVLPWGLSRSVWHGWGAQMPAALARASRALGDRSLLRPAIKDAVTFSAHLLVAGGPDNGWLPAPTDRTQIAYGADSRVQSLLAVADAADVPGPRRLAAVAASWYFGNNAAGVTAYDPATGTAVDGIAGDGTVNRNSGAESTIHTLLSMLALEGAPDVAAAARIARVRERVSTTVVEAESGRFTGGARAVRPDSPWTGESQWSGGGYAELPAGSSVCVDLPADPGATAGGRLAVPVVWRTPGPNGGTRWTAGGRPLGTVDHGDAGAQGVSAVPGVLLPVNLREALPAAGEPGPLCAAGSDVREAPLQVDGVLLQPLVERVVLEGGDHGQVLLRGFDRGPRTVPVEVPGTGEATVAAYDASGRLVRSESARAAGSATREAGSAGGPVAATVLPGGFTLVTR